MVITLQCYRNKSLKLQQSQADPACWSPGFGTPNPLSQLSRTQSMGDTQTMSFPQSRGTQGFGLSLTHLHTQHRGSAERFGLSWVSAPIDFPWAVG